MRFLAFVSFSLFVGIALGSPIGQLADEVTTILPLNEVRDDIVADATTVVVEVLANESATSVAVTQRARQGGTGEDEDDGDNEEGEATTAAVSVRNKPEIPQPFANASDFLAEFQYSSQFNLGPKEGAPLVENAPVVQAVGGGAPVAANPQVAPAVPPASGASAAAGEDEDEADSEEATEAPAAREQPQEQRVEESDSDNEITNDDPATTVKSFISEYEYTVQRLGDRGSERDDAEIPTELESASLNMTSTYGLDDLDFETAILSDGDGRAACECGRLPFRVPIGEEANINVRPWTVAIVRAGLIAGGRPHCAGVLINDRYVLTSASCMDGLHPSGIQVWLTAHSSLNNHHLDTGNFKLNVQDVVMHPNYNRGSHDNDIALVKMTQPVDISTRGSGYFSPVCIPAGSNSDYSGRSATVFGWGNGRVNRICSTTVPVLDNGVCRRDSRHGTRITDNMMCAGYLTPEQPIRTEDCIPDAGSPLTVQVNSRTSLIGVTSWGYEHHNRGHTPTVYTKVSSYADWILHNTGDGDWCNA